MLYIDLTTGEIDRALDQHAPHAANSGFLALLPEAESARLPMLQSACRRRGLALAGGVFPALIVGERFATQGAWLFHFENMPPRFLLAPGGEDGLLAAPQIVAALTEALDAISPQAREPALFLVFDGMVGNIASLLEAVYFQIANRVDYGGVNAGSERFQPMPCLFDENRLVGDGVLGLLLPGEMGSRLFHGFDVPRQAMSATSTHGNRIQMIDWQPAFETYRTIILARFGVELTRDNFYRHAVHFPLGILRANGDVVVRMPVAVADDGSLHCIGEVPENSVLVLLQSPSAADDTRLAHFANTVRNVAEGRPADPLMVFYCAGRRMHLGGDAEKELAGLVSATGTRQMGGALSLGEVGSTNPGGYPMFHNASLVCLPWSKR